MMGTDDTRPTGEPGRVGKRVWNLDRRIKSMSIVVGVAVVAIITLAACTNLNQPSSATTPTVPDSGSVELIPDFHDFQMTVYQGEDVLGGSEVNFSELLAQGKSVVLNMWAGLCPPCRVEMPDMQEVYDEYKDRILLLGVDVGPFTGLGSREDGQALLQELEVTYPTGTTFDAEVMRAYQVIGMPTTFFIKPNGEIVQKWTGLLTKDKLTELVAELLEASDSSR